MFRSSRRASRLRVVALTVVHFGGTGRSPAADTATLLPGGGVLRLVAGPRITCVVGPTEVRCAGENPFQMPADPRRLAGASRVDFGLRSGCLLDAGGTPRCWGDGSLGQLGRAPSSLSDLSLPLRRFLAVVERTLGVKAIIYTGPKFWNRYMSGAFGEHPLWIAEYGVDQPMVPKGWNGWQIWQWRGNVDLPEVAPIVDLNRVHPDMRLDALLIPAVRPAPKPH